MKIWEEQINKKGGLLGRPVKLIYYDDQTNPSTVPGIYTKLIDVDKVDLVVGPYATNMIAPAMPVVMQKGKVFVARVRSRGQQRVQLSEIFRDDPDRAEHQAVLHRRLLRCRRASKIQGRQTVAIIAADAEFARNACEGARENAKKNGFNIVYDRTYPPSTTDFTPIVRAIQAANPDVGEYLLLSAGLGRHGAHGQRSRLQAEDDRRRDGRPAGDRDQDAAWSAAQRLRQLRDLGAVASRCSGARGQAFLKEYQSRASAEGVDPLGYYLGTWGYAYIELLGKAVEGAKSLDDNKIAEYIRANPIKTIMGEIKFGKNGEWTEFRNAASAVSRHQEQ